MKIRIKAILYVVIFIICITFGVNTLANSFECMYIIYSKMVEEILYMNETQKNIQYTKDMLYYAWSLGLEALSDEDLESPTSKIETAKELIKQCTCIIYENDWQDEELKELYIDTIEYIYLVDRVVDIIKTNSEN